MSGAKLDTKNGNDPVIRLHTCVKQNLTNNLDKSGAVLYSTNETLKPFWMLIVGTNPGGSATELGGSQYAIKNNIVALAPELLSKEWGENGELTPLQKRIKLVVEEWLEAGSLKYAPYTNLIFMRTKNTTTINWNWADTCWPVNEFLLDTIQPSLILTIGNGRRQSPYAFLSSKLKAQNESSCPSGFGRYALRSATGHHRDRKITLLGLPHLSRYPIGSYENKVRGWINKQKQMALAN